MKTLLTLLLLIPILSWGLDKDELKEELKYWKSLLEDDLISQEDYDLKKNELLNFKPQKSNTSNTKKTSEEVTGHETYFPLDRGRTFSIQNKLNNLGYEITVDGVAGKETNQALDIWKLCNNYKNYNHKAHTMLLKSTTFCPNKFKPIYELTQNPDFYIEPKYGSKIKSLNKGTTFMIIGKKDDYWKIKLEKEVIGIGTKTDQGFIRDNSDLIVYQENSKIKYTYCVKSSKTDKNTTSINDIIPREGNCQSNEIVIKIPYWCNYGTVSNPKLLEGCPKNSKVKLVTNSSKTETNSSNSKINNQNNNNVISKKTNKCSGLKSEQNILYKGITGYWSEKDACIKITNYTDTKLCMRLKFEEDKQYVKTDKMINMYKEEAYKRNITCIDGTAFKSDNSNTQSILSQKKLEKKLEKKMQCTARRTEWRTLCKTGDYRLVNGVSCYGRWYDNLHC